MAMMEFDSLLPSINMSRVPERFWNRERKLKVNPKQLPIGLRFIYLKGSFANLDRILSLRSSSDDLRIARIKLFEAIRLDNEYSAKMSRNHLLARPLNRLAEPMILQSKKMLENASTRLFLRN